MSREASAKSASQHNKKLDKFKTGLKGNRIAA
jgi:hypothetical protein